MACEAPVHRVHLEDLRCECGELEWPRDCCPPGWIYHGEVLVARCSDVDEEALALMGRMAG